MGRGVGKWKGDGFPILVPLHHDYCDFKEVAIAFPVGNALRLVAVAELADVGVRRGPPTSGPLHGGVKT